MYQVQGLTTPYLLAQHPECTVAGHLDIVLSRNRIGLGLGGDESFQRGKY